MTPRDALAQLAAGRVAPAYLLVGDDEAGKAPLVAALDALVDEDLRGFNLHKVYATDQQFSLGQVLADARTLPFVGGRRVVEVFRAELFLKPKRAASSEADDDEGVGDGGGGEDAERTAGDAAELERYLAAPAPETCLVLVAADVHRGTRLGRRVVEHAVVVEFTGIVSEHGTRAPAANPMERAERFIRDEAAAKGVAIDEAAIARILAHAGGDPGVLRGDVARVLTFADGRARVTEEDVRAVVGGEVAHDDWAMIHAIGAGDAVRALRTLHLMLDGGRSPHQILGQLGWFVRTKLPGLAASRVRGAVRAVFETDLALKTSRGDPQVLLERLVLELCGEERRTRAGTGPVPTPGPGWRRR